MQTKGNNHHGPDPWWPLFIFIEDLGSFGLDVRELILKGWWSAVKLACIYWEMQVTVSLITNLGNVYDSTNPLNHLHQY